MSVLLWNLEWELFVLVQRWVCEDFCIKFDEAKYRKNRSICCGTYGKTELHDACVPTSEALLFRTRRCSSREGLRVFVIHVRSLYLGIETWYVKGSV